MRIFFSKKEGFPKIRLDEIFWDNRQKTTIGQETEKASEKSACFSYPILGTLSLSFPNCKIDVVGFGLLMPKVPHCSDISQV